MKFSAPVLFLFAVVYASGVANAGILELDKISDVIINARKVWNGNSVDDLMNSDRIPYFCKMAVNYGDLNNATIKTLDEDLQVIIAATINLFKKKYGNSGRMEFVDYVHALKSNPFLKTEITDNIYRGEYEDFHEYDSQRQQLAKNEYDLITTWIKDTLIKDDEALKDTTFNKIDFKNIVAATNAAFDHFQRFEGMLVNKPYVQSAIVDLSVIRYPDSKQSYFKLFRIQIFATKTSSSDPVRDVQSTSGVRGSFESIVFRPQNLVIDGLNAVVREKALKTAQSMFSDS
ncbi:uncharacterized protein LOC106875292 [Octopus bimaculoides]|uniref:Uncharacterized protein n=1 Tax=Octopus bimaculoides TaxID=37653 RepID=A0A0L8GR51_OCTBM|nr:uncharacterized protein LOC106875292 [Octopus bimaculoides]|eukprot:XP_014778868.1 PREDICTED: uncharacterized protein LOC106875292 [Octopus bimaculoides]